MLTFYYHPLSPVSRRVWIALLEKAISFEPVIVNLMGDQFKPEFLSLNPFHHVPVIVEGSLQLVESLAILDYLEARYPNPSLLPNTPDALGIVRMVQMVTVNEITPKLPMLVAGDRTSSLFAETMRQLDTALKFLDAQVGEQPFFGSDDLTVADIVAGSTLPLLARSGVSLSPYAALNFWYQKITAREAWQMTEPSDADFTRWTRWVTLQIKRHQRQHRADM